jgi:hypothetical protein
VKGDPCYEKVIWAMQRGISEKPESLSYYIEELIIIEIN